jgi:hypothetical protein
MYNQEYHVDRATQTVYTEINEPFYTAHTQLGWNFKSEGLGVNKEIIFICFANKYALNIKCGKSEYKFSYTTLKKILSTLNTSYLVKAGTELHVLPVALSYNGLTALDKWG